ncbi:MAG: MFS transporter [Alphaproteobacteria bacterium]|jgi:MFS family permease
MLKKIFGRIRRKWDKYEPVPKTGAAAVRKALPFAIGDGPASQAMETLASGPFLVAYALALGANNLVIGLLAALPFLGNFAQAPAAYLVEKVRKRKKLALVISFCCRPLFLIAALLAFFVPNPVLPTLLVLCFAGRYLCGSAATCTWNSWMRDLLPVKIQGRYYAARLRYMTVAVIACNLLGAFLIDRWNVLWPSRGIYAYSFLLFLSFCAGMVSIYCMSRVPEPAMAPDEEVELSFARKFIEPFKVPNFRRLMTFLGVWNFGLNLVAPFFTVVLIRQLGISLTGVVLLTILSQLSSFFIISIWGAIADRFSNKSVLSLAVPVYIFSILLWIFTTWPETHVMTVPLLVLIYVLIGIATAGVNLAANNIALKLAPRGRAAVYLSANSVVNAVCAGTAPIIGGTCADFFQDIQLSLIVQWKTALESVSFQTLIVSHWDFFFMFAAFIGSFSLLFLTRVREQGEVKEAVVLQEFLNRTRRSFSNLASFTFLRMKFSEKPPVPPVQEKAEEEELTGWGS